MRAGILSWGGALLIVVALSVLTSALLIQTWRWEELERSSIDRIAAPLASHLPVGRASPTIEQWFAHPRTHPLFLGNLVNQCFVVETMPDGSVTRTFGMFWGAPPDATENPGYIWSLVSIFVLLHVVVVVFLALLYRLAGYPPWVRQPPVVRRALPSALAISAIAGALWPAFGQVVWSVWIRVAEQVRVLYMTTDPLTGETNMVSADHYYGVAVGPVGRASILAGVALGYLLTVAWVIRWRIAAAKAGVADPIVCLACGHGLDEQQDTCPECGQDQSGAVARVALGRILYQASSSRWRWGVRIGMFASVLALLAGPLILGWVGVVVPNVW